ncbi:hypothetical protein N7507_000269 [Penicillium longicatenatum]|nr:hypothetical protein N7507_000269 [Penicillium longicatenatum]
MHLSKQACLNLAALVVLVAAVTALPSTSQDLAIRTPGEVDPHSGWDGSTGLAERSRVGYLGNAAILLGAIITGSCTLSGINPAALPVCVAAIGFACIGVFINLLGAALSDKRSLALDDDADGHFKFHYPSIGGGASMFEQVQTAFHSGDGLPIHIADTSCENNQTCHRMWYSKVEKTGASNQTRIFHHIHATPTNHDFRSNSTTKRSSVQDADDNVTEKSGDKLYGGYVFEDLQESTDEDILNVGAKTGGQEVIDKMSDQYTNQNKKFNTEGIYCMDFDTNSHTDAGTAGYLWYYNDQSSYPSGEEDSFMDTCSEEATN